ncbi:MAG: M23 family metallopeptidase, partial [Oscillibacter sp.]|nr:M23 family metallopeptidase [Oscillibacter sp.]
PDASAAKDSGAVSGAASVPAAGKSVTGDAKPSAKSDGGAKATTDAKSGKTEAKSKDSVAKANQSDAKSKSDGKADAAKPSGKATRPVEGETVTSFSMDKLLYNETMRDWRTHDGIDIAADAGTAVVAARPGTVETVEADPIMGTTVTVRHEGKWESVYASLADMAEVEAGDEVSAGQVLGFVGETAASESALGPHLHFSVLNDGTPVDPETFLA